MPYKNAPYWFIGLFILTLVGFWESYFSKLTGDVHITHHAHGITGLIWLLMLIVQPWLIHHGHRQRHRTIGRWSIIVVAGFVLTGYWVTFYGQAQVPDPTGQFFSWLFFLGLFSVTYFAVMYLQALRFRRSLPLHSRFMVATSFAFIVPGLARAIEHYWAPLGFWTPSFYQVTLVPLLVSVIFLVRDLRAGQPWSPWLQSALWWTANAVAWFVLPGWGPWQRFAAWSATVVT